MSSEPLQWVEITYAVVSRKCINGHEQWPRRERVFYMDDSDFVSLGFQMCVIRGCEAEAEPFEVQRDFLP